MKKLLSVALLAIMMSTAHAATLVYNGDFGNINGISPYTYQFVPVSVPGFVVNSAAGSGYQAAVNPSGFNSNLAFFHTLGGVDATLTTTTPVATVQAGFNYTITLDIASEAGIYPTAPDPGNVTLQFLVDSTPIGTPFIATAGSDLFSSTNPSAPRIGSYSVTLTALEASAYLTKDLNFQVFSNAIASTQDEFDNISLTVTPEVISTPEPSTWAMMLGGLGMLVAFQRMRRTSNS